MKQLILPFILLSIVGCGSENRNGSEEGVPDPIGINGSWLSSCYYFGSGLYAIDYYHFFGYSFTGGAYLYDDSHCLGAVIHEVQGAGTFTIGETVMTQSGMEAKEIDVELTIEDMEFSILDLILVNGDTLYWGSYSETGERPTSLDFDIVLMRQ